MVKFTAVLAVLTDTLMDNEVNNPRLFFTPQTGHYFPDGMPVQSSFVAITSSRSNNPKYMLVLWTYDSTKYAENPYIRLKFRLPWYGEMLIFATAIADPTRIINFRGNVDFHDVMLTIGACRIHPIKGQY